MLLLDEPTNHLDLEGRRWRADQLAGYRGAVLVISHDRRFLDQTVTRVVELDGIRPELQDYPGGGYTAYRQERERRWQRLLLDHEAQEKYRTRLEADIERTKAQARGVEVDNPRNPGARRLAKKVARKALSRQRRLEREMTSARWLAEPETRPGLVLSFPEPDSSDDHRDLLLDCAGLSVTVGDRVLVEGAELRLDRGDRVLVSGVNGAGKSSLLRCLAPLLPGSQLLPQTHDHLPGEVIALDYFRSRVPVHVDRAEEVLEGFLFDSDDRSRALGDLSVGQVRHLLLAVIVNTPAEVLLLDEPTNYLDFEALDVVEAALASYRGALVVVTHDEVLADRIGLRGAGGSARGGWTVVLRPVAPQPAARVRDVNSRPEAATTARTPAGATSSVAAPAGRAVSVLEVRVLEGPNLYFTRPAVKVSLALPGYLAADESTLRAIAERLALKGSQPGGPSSEQRQRFVLRLVERVVRLIATGAGRTRLGVRARPATARAEMVVAFPWSRRGRGEALGACLGEVLAALLDGEAAGREGLERASATVRDAEPGARPDLPKPTIPVASITGTNGKTTTTRLLAHIGMAAGLRTAWSSTDGVLAQGQLIEAGDYSGPAGARAVLASPGVQLAVLETARGGLLLRGMGVPSNDVSVVTNVSADHLGLQGIDTVDQLAEVKAIITTVTKPTGWVVLNGDDPRVWAMSTSIKARPWAFSLDPDSPALRSALSGGGRAITVLDGDVVVLAPGADPDHVVRVVDVPVTLSGLSEHNIANALAATAAAFGLGLPRNAIVEGLRTFAPDPSHNPGRMNVYTLPLPTGGSVSVIIDLAHNEAGLEALLGVAEGLRPPGSYVQLGLGTGGDRTDEILVSLGELAGRRADLVQIVHKEHYLRGRTMEDLELHLREGLGNVGVLPTHSWPTELEGLQGLAAVAEDGDVIAMMCHADRPLLEGWLREHGATPDTPRDIRRKVIAARGEHELESEIGAMREQADAARVAGAQLLLDARPGDARLLYELASAHDSAGAGAAAIPLYEQAIASGLREPHRYRALIGLASTYRSAGRLDEARQVLDDLVTYRPSSATVAALRALVANDSGDRAGALAGLIRFVTSHATDPEDTRHTAALEWSAAHLR